MLNNELNNVNDWLKLNKLSLNLKKCQYVMVHTHKKMVKPLHLMIDEAIIERVAEFNFLGLILIGKIYVQPGMVLSLIHLLH